MLSVEEALERVLALATPLATEQVPLAKAAGQFSAHALSAQYPLPPFANSAMDGYAITADDLRDATPQMPVLLPAGLEASAGSIVAVHRPGTASRIFTGAPIPDGADAVVMQETTTRTEGYVSFTGAPIRGAHIRQQGSDLAEGQLLLAKGTRIGPTELAVLASQRLHTIEVHRRPNTALLLTGDEIVPTGQEANALEAFANGRAMIPDTNGPMLTALLEATGSLASPARYVRDGLEPVAHALDESLNTHDVVISVGGVSVGDHDYVAEAAKQVGAEVAFWKVAMKPGKPLLVCKRDKSVLFGLPGNPVSAFVTYLLFVRPYLQAIAGSRDWRPQTIQATLAGDADHAIGRDEFARVTVSFDASGPLPRATLHKNQGSGSLSSLLGANGLARLSGQQAHFAAGSPVPVFLL